MAQFVFVHGSHFGGWIWRRVADYLESKGHRGERPSLTGLGDRRNLLTPEVGLITHIEDVLAAVENHKMSDVVMIGHSYGGMVIASVADRIPERIGRMVYVDAVVPRDGESLMDLMDTGTQAFVENLAKTAGEGWRLPLWSVSGMNLSTEDMDLLISEKTPHPYRTFVDPLRRPAAPPIPTAYVRFTNPRMPLFDLSETRSRQAGWTFREFSAGHFAMLSHPIEIGELLLELTE
jgi:pimeloyl-ACP methyl ester carboxylesterase